MHIASPIHIALLAPAKIDAPNDAPPRPAENDVGRSTRLGEDRQTVTERLIAVIVVLTQAILDGDAVFAWRHSLERKTSVSVNLTAQRDIHVRGAFLAAVVHRRALQTD